MKNKTFLSVCMITYNHENYIKQAIDGILMQNTSFNFEFVISNDCSKDDTHKVIECSIKDVPKHISVRYFNQKNNLGMNANFLFALKQCKGKYITFCDGDDFWTDPTKLAKQVAFLEKNKDYSLSCHDAYVIDNKGDKISESFLEEFHKKDYTQDELISGKMAMPLTICFKNNVIDYPKEFLKVSNPDVFLFSLLGNYGKSKFQKEILPSAYRFHEGGVVSMLPTIKKYELAQNTYYHIFKYYKSIKSFDISNSFFKKFVNISKLIGSCYIKEGQINNFVITYLKFIKLCLQNFKIKQSIYSMIDFFKILLKKH